MIALLRIGSGSLGWERFERYADEVRVCETSRARGRELIAMSRAILIIVSAMSVSVILNTVELRDRLTCTSV